MNDGGASISHPLDRADVEQIVAVSAVEANEFMAEPSKVTRNGPPNAPTMPRHQDPAHDNVCPSG